MIDLRSDTVTLPSSEMLLAIMSAELGDDGRVSEDYKGGDPTVRLLEKRAAQLTGKEDAILLPTGTMANHLAILSSCQRGDNILLDEKSHIIQSEKVIFDEEFFGMKANFFHVTERNKPSLTHIEKILVKKEMQLLCLENTHNYYGGIHLTVDELGEIYELANEHQVPVHIDGARIFNASVALGLDVSELCHGANTVTFCLSKGLGAPIGSLLCGSKEQMNKVRQLRKYLGGTMRQAGIIAAAGLIALETSNIKKLQNDHELANILARDLSKIEGISIDPNKVDTNLLVFKLTLENVPYNDFISKLKDKGLLAKVVANKFIRLTTHRDVNIKDINNSVAIIKKTITELTP